MEDEPNPQVIFPAIIISIILFTGVYIAFRTSQSRTSTIVLPGGITYLGPTPTATPHPAITSLPTPGGKIPIPPDATWALREGTIFPYAFSYPQTLSLGTFPSDPYDAVTVFYGNTDANTNIFFRVDDLKKLNKTQYEGKTEAYANNWWKDYAWKGTSSISPFTNTNGIIGYRAKYLDNSGNTPYDHVFFSVPDRPDLVIWMSGRLFTQDIFDRMVESVSWK